MSAIAFRHDNRPPTLVLTEPIGHGCVLRSNRLASRTALHLTLWPIDAGSPTAAPAPTDYPASSPSSVRELSVKSP